FTHIYCTRCKAIKPAKREPNVIGCAACDTLLLGLDEKECGKCETCGLQPLEHGSLDSEDISGQFLGGDILCNHCRLILATVYKKNQRRIQGRKITRLVLANALSIVFCALQAGPSRREPWGSDQSRRPHWQNT